MTAPKPKRTHPPGVTAAIERRRVQELNEFARTHGYPTWRRLSTAILRGRVKLVFPDDGSEASVQLREN